MHIPTNHQHNNMIKDFEDEDFMQIALDYFQNLFTSQG